MTDREAVLTVADVLTHLRQRLITAIENQDEKTLDDLESVLYAIQETIIALHPRNSAHLLRPIDHMISAIQDYFHQETWKSTIPSTEEIQLTYPPVDNKS
jgi:signal-transduction protein with cAMP-binding, CBS, and nucleotidyltransferase domain